MTRIVLGALVNVGLTEVALEAVLAAAGELVDAVHAFGVVPARLRLALVDVNLAVDAWTRTSVLVRLVQGLNELKIGNGEGGIANAKEIATLDSPSCFNTNVKFCRSSIIIHQVPTS